MHLLHLHKDSTFDYTKAKYNILEVFLMSILYIASYRLIIQKLS